VTRGAAKAAYQIATTGAGESQFDMLARLQLDDAAHRELAAYCNARRIMFLSSPFDEQSADLLDELGVPAFKLSSGELTNIAFLRHVARKGKPMIVSTGMGRLGEVARAVEAVRDAGCRDLILLHCVSNYPAAPHDVNLRAMVTLREAFGTPVGFSDHTEGDAAAVAAVALGAAVIEKHFTMDRNLPGPDHRASIEPTALADMVVRIRTAEVVLGHGRKEPAASEAPVARIARKSLVAARDIPAGAVVERGMIVALRPGTGLPPDQIDRLVGRTAAIDIPAGALLTLEMLS
jgi:sialic acid synthase SpsE